MEITEKDLFIYIWDPSLLRADKLDYLNDNKLQFRGELEILISCYISFLKDLDSSILSKIINKISSYNNSAKLKNERNS